MFQSLQQGASIYILYKNDPKVEIGRIISINTHLPQFNPNQPQAMLGGMVTDITVSVGNDTIPFVGIPANASMANFADRGIFISENQALVVNELSAMRDASQRVVDSYESHKSLLEKCNDLLISLDPDKQKDAQSAKEIAALKSELEEMKKMLSAALGTKSNEQ